MRLALTVVSPAAGRQADVLLEADPGTRWRRSRAAGSLPDAGPGRSPAPGRRRRPPGTGPCGRVAGRPRAAGRAPVALYVDQGLVPPGQALGESPIRQGGVVSLGHAAGCLAPEPGGVVEIRVAAARQRAACTGSRSGEADIGAAGPRAHPDRRPAAARRWR